MKTGIIITSHDGHLELLRETIVSAKRAADYVICGYDIHEVYPPVETALLCDMFFVIGHGYKCKCRVCTKRTYRARMFEAWQSREALWWMLRKTDYVLKIEGDIGVHEENGVKYMVENLLDGHDLLLFPRGTGRRHRTGQFSTAIFLGKTTKLVAIFTELKEHRMQMLEIQFSDVIRKMKLNGELTYKCVRMGTVSDLLTNKEAKVKPYG